MLILTTVVIEPLPIRTTCPTSHRPIGRAVSYRDTGPIGEPWGAAARRSHAVACDGLRWTAVAAPVVAHVVSARATARPIEWHGGLPVRNGRELGKGKNGHLGVAGGVMARDGGGCWRLPCDGGGGYWRWLCDGWGDCLVVAAVALWWLVPVGGAGGGVPCRGPVC